METKTIRFEKGDFYTGKEIKEMLIPPRLKKKFIEGLQSYTPKKSFTVQINIIEDEESNG